MLKPSEVPENFKDSFSLKFQGSEAKIYFGKLCGKPAVLKERFVKRYLHPDLDKKISNERMRAECKAIEKCLSIGVKCPALYYVDKSARFLVMEQIENSVSIRQYIDNVCRSGGDPKILSNLALKIGQTIAELHDNSFVHGDLTTSNMLLKANQLDAVSSGEKFDLYLIDFGLSHTGAHCVDKASDLIALEKIFLSTHPDCEEIFKSILSAYFEHSKNKDVHTLSKKLDAMRQMGRKRALQIG